MKQTIKYSVVQNPKNELFRASVKMKNGWRRLPGAPDTETRHESTKWLIKYMRNQKQAAAA